MTDDTDVTELLEAACRGDSRAADELLPVVYGQLRELARSQLRGERADHTLQATALVHEAYVRLVGQRTAGWDNRAQFLAVAAKAMRRILVDHARARAAVKRGRREPGATLDEVVDRLECSAPDLLLLDEALRDLARVDARKASVVELRFFAGLTMPEVAAAMQVPLRTVTRDWTFAKAWLYERLRP